IVAGIAALPCGNARVHGSGLCHGVRYASRNRRLTASMYALFAFVAGLVFGIGLLVSQMANPAKVLGFLDLAGSWDPSLAFVMAGAVCVAVIGFFLAGRRSTTLLGTPFFLPSARVIDTRLVGGALLFGIGWGLGGFCPGPALVAIGAGQAKGF